jgi:hypothetical protein
MLTALASCQPIPGPAGAAWPAAKPGTGYCGPCPSCCPPSGRTDTALYAAPGLMTLLTAALAVIVIREVRRSRRLRERA